MHKGLLVFVYRMAGGGTDCTAGGVTGKFNQCVLVGPGIPEVTEATDNCPVLFLEKHYGGYRAVPDSDPSHFHKIGPMFGGNFVYTSDDRMPTKAPIKVHDRFEVPYR